MFLCACLNHCFTENIMIYRTFINLNITANSFFPYVDMANIMYASCKVGITRNSKHTDCSKWQLCSSQGQQLAFCQKGRNSDPNPHAIIISSEMRGRVNGSILGSTNLQVQRFICINHLLIISSFTLAYALNYDFINWILVLPTYLIAYRPC